MVDGKAGPGGPEPEVEPAFDFIDHIDDWIEYLLALLDNPEQDHRTAQKYKRQLKYLVRFRTGANSNIVHNKLLLYYYGSKSQPGGDDISLPGENRPEPPRHPLHPEVRKDLDALRRELADYGLDPSMSVIPTAPFQENYLKDAFAYNEILKALACEDLFFLQGPPGTGKTTAIVEIVLQVLLAKPNARILITSETHIAVDNALDRLTKLLRQEQMGMVMRYPEFEIVEFENPLTPLVQADRRAKALWQGGMSAAPDLTLKLWERLERGRVHDDGKETLPRWLVRNLADKHQIIGVTCNQIDHLLDAESEMFDLAIVDECSKATLPEWIMAMSVARKCILVGDHKQLPPTFCSEESDVLSRLSEHKERLIRRGVIDRLFDNLPQERKGMLKKQYRMLPHIGAFISEQFYEGTLEHDRTQTTHPFAEFGWLTYTAKNHRVPAQRGSESKILVNELELRIIIDGLHAISSAIHGAEKGAFPKRLTVAVVTPYRAQCKRLKDSVEAEGFSERLSIEVDTVDAFQGRQADIVFFSFVRTTGPATFYADDRRMNVAISRARDAVYLVGDTRYLAGQKARSLQALMKLPVLRTTTFHEM